MRSLGHRENILNGEYRRIGVGVSIETKTEKGWLQEVVFATQNFSSCE